VMKTLHDGVDFHNQPISAVMAKPLPILEESADVTEAYRVFLTGAAGIVVSRQRKPVGLITRADLIASWVEPVEEAKDPTDAMSYEL